jgi:hypothetical protein
MQPTNLCHQEKCTVEIAKSGKLSGTFVLAVLPGVSIESAFDFVADCSSNANFIKDRTLEKGNSRDHLNAFPFIVHLWRNYILIVLVNCKKAAS